MPAGLGWDFANFYDAGRRAAAGQIADLYRPAGLIAGEPPQGTLAFWSAPLTAWLYAPLAVLPPRAALAVFKLQNLLAYLAALAALYLLHRPLAGGTAVERWRFTAFYAVLCLIYQPFWSVFRVGGQTTPTVLLLFVLALAAHMRGRLGWSSLLVVAAVLIKPALVTALLVLVLSANWRFAAWTAVHAAGAALLSLATAPWDLHRQFLSRLLTAAGEVYPWFWNSSLHVPLVELEARWPALTGSPAPPALFTAASLGLQAAVAVTVAALLVQGLRRPWPERARRHFQVLVALAFFLLVSRTVWEHYLALLFPLLSFLVARERRLGGAARSILVAVFVFCLGQNVLFTDLLRQHLQPLPAVATLALALLKSAPLYLTWALLWWHRETLLESYDTGAWREATG